MNRFVLLPTRSAHCRLVMVGIVAVLLAGCSDNKASEALVKGSTAKEGPGSEVKKVEIVNPVIKYGVEGFYTGMFTATKYKDGEGYLDNLITISIDSMNTNQVFGHSIVAGNARPFTGSYTKDADDYSFEAKEPGDDKYDGKFSFNIKTSDKTLSGTWKANDPKIRVTAREYELKPRTYKYSADLKLPEEVVGYLFEDTYREEENEAEALTKDAIKYNASTVLLKASNIENMYRADLEAMRNAIYARHGYSFKNKRMRNLFDTYVEWYMPVTTDATSLLTDTEQKNILLIKRYEKHAGKYYDNYGR